MTTPKNTAWLEREDAAASQMRIEQARERIATNYYDEASVTLTTARRLAERVSESAGLAFALDSLQSGTLDRFDFADLVADIGSGYELSEAAVAYMTERAKRSRGVDHAALSAWERLSRLVEASL